jgi:hypothetical protein
MITWIMWSEVALSAFLISAILTEVMWRRQFRGVPDPVLSRRIARSRGLTKRV